MRADLALDLGTTASRVAGRAGVVAVEPSVVALRTGPRGRTIEAIGAPAREMLGRAPTGVDVVRPVRGGVIADFETTEHLLHHLIRRATGRSLLKPRIVVPVPASVTDVERRAVQDGGRAAGARDVAVVPAALVAGLGAGLAIDAPKGQMIIDVGAGVTQVAVLALNGIVLERCQRVGGDTLDEAVVLWMRSRHGVAIGVSTAEALRHEVGRTGTHQAVRGRDVATGRPREVKFGAADLAAACDDTLLRVRDTVLQALAETPPELSADLHEHGVVLCGGLSRMPTLGRLLRESTGLAVSRAAEPELCVIRGAALLLDNQDLLARVAAG